MISLYVDYENLKIYDEIEEKLNSHLLKYNDYNNPRLFCTLPTDENGKIISKIWYKPSESKAELVDPLELRNNQF